jgi:biopolymer transport protein ExbD
MSNYVAPTTPIGGPAGQPLPPQQSFQPPPPKKLKVKVWVLVGCVIAVFLGGYYVRNKVKEAGLDFELMQKSPALALAKVLVAANPDVLELVSVDEEQGLITIRNKKSGETSTVSINSTTSLDVKDASVVFAIPGDGEPYIGRDKIAQEDMPTWVRNILKDKPGEIVYISSGKKVKYGTVVSVKDSIREAGFSVKLPDWFPPYPGAVVQGAFSTKSKDGERTYFGFSTNDSIEKVVKFYEENLKQAGLKITTNTVQQNGVVSKGSLASENGDKKPIAFVTAISEEGQTQVTVVFAPK